MDRLRPAMLIAALVVDVGRRLPRRCGSAMPPSARLIRVRRVSRSLRVVEGTSEVRSPRGANRRSYGLGGGLDLFWYNHFDKDSYHYNETSKW